MDFLLFILELVPFIPMKPNANHIFIAAWNDFSEIEEKKKENINEKHSRHKNIFGIDYVRVIDVHVNGIPMPVSIYLYFFPNIQRML